MSNIEFGDFQSMITKGHSSTAFEMTVPLVRNTSLFSAKASAMKMISGESFPTGQMMLQFEDNQTTAMAHFFSASVLNDMAKSGESASLARLIKESGLLTRHSDSLTVAEIFDIAFEVLKKRQNRHEYIYKAAITQKVLLGIHSLQTASMLSEFRVGPCKADIVILNGTGTVYEIKSERDTLSRLKNQIDAYSDVFAKVNVIVGSNHVAAVQRTLPEYVGIQVLSDRHQITCVREGVNNAARTDSGAIFDAITLKEAEKILVSAKIEVPNVPNTLRYKVWREQFTQLDSVVAHDFMVDTLKQTRTLMPLKQLLEDIPESLICASLTGRLRKKDHGQLLKALQTPLKNAAGWN